MNGRMGLTRSLGGLGLWATAISASSPLTVLIGGLPTMFAVNAASPRAAGLAVPVSFVVLTIALVPVAVGIAAASRRIGHAGTMYAVLAQGRGRPLGLAGAVVALLSYTAIEVSLLGLLGAGVADRMGGTWWGWALAAWAVVGLLGVGQVGLNATLIGLGVLAQVGVAAAVVWAALDHSPLSLPALSESEVDFTTGQLWGSGTWAVLAFGIAAFIGFESAASFQEEARQPTSPARATVAALLFLGTAYAALAWGLGAGIGASRVAALAAGSGGRFPLSLLGGWAGPATLVAWAAIVAAMASFHNLAARYLYAMAREGILPAALSRVGRGASAGAPRAASAVQSGLVLAVIVVVVVVGVEPVAGLFVVASTLAAIGVLTLLVAGSWAAAGYFRSGGGGNESRAIAVLATNVGVVTGGLVLAATVTNLDALLGVPTGSMVTWVLPGVVGLAAMVGVVWAGWLHRRRPDVYERIGRGVPKPLAQLDARLTGLKV
jgi:amino acid transporter